MSLEIDCRECAWFRSDTCSECYVTFIDQVSDVEGRIGSVEAAIGGGVALVSLDAARADPTLINVADSRPGSEASPASDTVGDQSAHRLTLTDEEHDAVLVLQRLGMVPETRFCRRLAQAG